jgi:hypothetical protein
MCHIYDIKKEASDATLIGLILGRGRVLNASTIIQEEVESRKK